LEEIPEMQEESPATRRKQGTPVGEDERIPQAHLTRGKRRILWREQQSTYLRNEQFFTR
jgi:hypothetical protein